MCYSRNIKVNFHRQLHTLERFNVEVQEHKTNLTASEVQNAKLKLHESVNSPSYGDIICIYDIRTILVQYNSLQCKRQKLADICLPPYINDDIYLMIIKYLREYFEKKVFKIVHLQDDYIYLYYEDECINTMINNMIVFHCTR